MDLFRMECFIAAVDYANLTRAAEHMNITQPAMSAQIRELEREVGFALLLREHSGVKPTAAGQLLRDGFANLIERYRALLADARACARGRPRLTIGYHGPVSWAGMPQFIAHFCKKYPEIELVLFQQQWKELAQYLSIGVLDVAFVEHEETVGNTALETLPLFHEGGCFALSPEHPLAGRQRLSIREIGSAETILMNNHSSASMGKIIKQLLLSGVSREQCRFFDQMEITLAMAASQQGIAALPGSFRTRNPALVYVDNDTDAIDIRYDLAWKRETTNGAVKLFIAECRQSRWPYQKEKSAK